MKRLRHFLPVLGILLLPMPVLRASSDEPQPISRSTVPYQLAILDRLTIQHADGTATAAQVSQDGLITLGGQSYRAKGLTRAGLSQLVERHEGAGVEVEVEEFRPNRISVLGEVYHQIFTEMSDGPMRVMDAIASANGFTPLANLRRVKLIRENAGEVEVYELDLRKVLRGDNSNQNMIVQPGDVITVPRNFL